MSNISNIADKFAMKLGLESRPAASPFGKIEDEFESFRYVPEPSPEEESEDDFYSKQTLKYEDNPHVAVKEHFDSIRGVMHNIGTQLSLGDFDEVKDLIEYAIYDLHSLNEMVDKLQKKRELDSSESDDSIFEETIHQDIEKEKPIQMVHFPSVMNEFLQKLDYMDSNELWQERKNVKKIMKDYDSRGLKAPFPLVVKLQEIEKKLKP